LVRARCSTLTWAPVSPGFKVAVGAGTDGAGGAGVVWVVVEVVAVVVVGGSGVVAGLPLEKTPAAARIAIRSPTATTAAMATGRSIVSYHGGDGSPTSRSQSSASSPRTKSSAPSSPAAAPPNQSSGSLPRLTRRA